MPDSGAVYQPTTVGYTYDSGGDGTGGGGGGGGGGGNGGGGGLRRGFWRVMSRHKLNSRKWLEWMLLSIALCSFVAGLTTMLIYLLSADGSPQTTSLQKVKSGEHTTMATTNVHQQMGDVKQSLIGRGAGMMLAGVLLGIAWGLVFFQRSKSSRNGMTGSSGQMLGGLNPSTDLLVGSTSQYGPVLTEVPSQLKMKQANSHDAPAHIPLSDQEEETHTLMQDSASPPSVSVGSGTIPNQIQG